MEKDSWVRITNLEGELDWPFTRPYLRSGARLARLDLRESARTTDKSISNGYGAMGPPATRYHHQLWINGTLARVKVLPFPGLPSYQTQWTYPCWWRLDDSLDLPLFHDVLHQSASTLHRPMCAPSSASHLHLVGFFCPFCAMSSVLPSLRQWEDVEVLVRLAYTEEH